MSLHNLPPECVSYVHCNFCNTNLAKERMMRTRTRTSSYFRMNEVSNPSMSFVKVDVPSNIMFNAVTVKCGHCGNLLSFNLNSASFGPTTSTHHHKENSYCQDVNEETQSLKSSKVAISQSSENEQTKTLSVNGGLGKRQRPPSAYNRFIKEEIRRIKANNPKINHREAFSMAAKNWAHLPLTHFGKDKLHN